MRKLFAGRRISDHPSRAEGGAFGRSARAPRDAKTRRARERSAHSVRDGSARSACEGSARYRRFYDRLALTNLIIFNLVVIAFGIATYLALYSSASLQFLAAYDEALSALNEAYSGKHDNFPYLLFPFHGETAQINALRKLIGDERDTMIYSDVAMAQSVASVMKRVCELDKDVVGVYLYKRSTGAVYAYHRGASFAREAEPYAFPEMAERTSYVRLVTGSRLIPDYRFTNQPLRPAYGIGGYLLGQIDEAGSGSANILVVYAQSALASKVPAALLKDGARFRVATAEGDTIYDSGEADGNANGNTNGDAGGNTNGNTNGDTGGNTNGNTNENADGIAGGNSNGNADGNANGNAVGLLGEAEEAGEAGEAGEAAGGLPLKELAAAGAGTVAIDGADYYKKSIVDGTYGYAAYYYLPQSVIDSQSQTAAIPIFLLVLGFSIVSAAIYRITLQVSGRRISQIEAGMREIGRRNFEYRMPVGRQNDELTLVASGFNSMCDQLQDTIDKVYLYNIRQREASLYALQTSINPHFLYNTLEAVRSKLEEDGSLEASEMIVMLSRIFEYQAKGDSYVTIGQELEALEMYVQFFSMRYDNRFAFRLDVQGDVGECMMPKYTLQPIMENYFIHGIRRGGDNHIAVTVCRSEGEIRIEAEDDGMGIAPAELASLRDRLARLQDSKKSLGLINVHQRLRYTYGAPYGIERIESGGGGEGDGDANGAGTRIVLRIRALRAEEIGRAALPAQGGG